jgi:endoglucanase
VSTQDAATVVAAMKIGWNLGNSLDAVEGETAWGNPLVTPELIAAVAAAGFGVVRVPVTWSMHLGAAPSYTIDSTWMARVDEVVGYVLDAGLYAVINLHHDGAENGNGEWISLLDESNQLSASHDAEVRDEFVKVWQQIADHFANHDGHVLFESMNEIKVGYGTPDPAYYQTINELNQAFVDTVRASGANNATRCLIIPGYNTNIDYTVAGFQRPTDPAAGRLILSVHYYDPWSFAGEGSTHVWGAASPGTDSWGQEAWVVEQFQELKTTYVDQGLPVVIGEYGAVNQNGYENYRRYYMEYVTKAAHDRGIVGIYWDNGGSGTGADAFGLFGRSSNAPLHPVITQAMMRAVTDGYTLDQVALP